MGDNNFYLCEKEHMYIIIEQLEEYIKIDRLEICERKSLR